MADEELEKKKSNGLDLASLLQPGGMAMPVDIAVPRTESERPRQQAHADRETPPLLEERREQQKRRQKMVEQQVVVLKEEATAEVKEKVAKPQEVIKAFAFRFFNGKHDFFLIKRQLAGQAEPELVITYKDKEYFVRTDKPFFKDHKTGRTMLRIFDPASPTQEKLFDPLSSKVILQETRKPAAVTKPEPVVRGRDLEDLAGKLQEEVKEDTKVKISAATRIEGHLTGRRKLDDEVTKHLQDRFGVVEPKNGQAPTQEEPEPPREVIGERERALREKTYLVYDVDDLFDDDKKVRRAFLVTLEDLAKLDQQISEYELVGDNEAIEKLTDQITDKQTPLYTYEMTEQANGQDDYRLEKTANPHDSAERHRDNTATPLTSPRVEAIRLDANNILTNRAEGLIDLNVEGRDLVRAINRLRPLTRDADPVTSAEARVLLNELTSRVQTNRQEREAERQNQPGEERARQERARRPGRNRLQELRKEFRRDEYYAGQAGTIPTPDFVGFSFMSRYTRDKDITETELVDSFKEEFDELLGHHNDATRLANRRYYVSMQKLFDTGKYRLHYDVAEDLVEDETSEDWGKIRKYTLQKEVNGQWVDAPPEVIDGFEPKREFTLGSEEDEKLLIMAQYAELKHRQREWLRKELEKVAITATDDQDLGRKIGHIKRSENNFLDQDINNHLEAMSRLYGSRVQFKKGLREFAGTTHAFQDVADYLMNLPGVAELLGEIEQREYSVWLKEEDGVQKRLTDPEKADQIVALKEKDKNTQRWLKAEVDSGRHPEYAVYLDPDDTAGDGGMNLTSTGKADDPERQPGYRRVRKGLMRAIIQKFEENRDTDVAELTQKLAEATETEKLDIIQKISQLRNQRVDESSVEVAEWIWRTSGRAAFFFDVSYEGQYQQFQINNQALFGIQKQRTNLDRDMWKLAWGIKDHDTARATFLPGTAEGYNLNAGWFDYFTNYTVAYPGNWKLDLLDAGMKKYVRPEVQRTVNLLAARRTAGGVDSEFYASLTQQQKDHLQEYHHAVTMRIDTDVWTKMKKNGKVWADWHDMGADLDTAAKQKQALFNFLEDPTLKNIGEFQKAENRWYRIWRVDKPTEDMMNTMIDYRTTFNKTNKQHPNWDADDIDFVITKARKDTMIDDPIKDKLEDKQLGTKIRGPVLPFTKHRLFEFNQHLVPKKLLGLPLRRWFVIWPAKYHNFFLKVFREGVAGFFSSLAKTWRKGITPPKV